MARGWTWIDDSSEGISEAEMDERMPLLDYLALQWSNLHDTEERQRFARQADIEDGYDDHEFEDEAQEKAHSALQRLRAEQHDAQLAFIGEQMHALGARMMRPYEHWNEDERYMQYMECDRFGGY